MYLSLFFECFISQFLSFGGIIQRCKELAEGEFI